MQDSTAKQYVDELKKQACLLAGDIGRFRQEFTGMHTCLLALMQLESQAKELSDLCNNLRIES